MPEEFDLYPILDGMKTKVLSLLQERDQIAKRRLEIDQQLNGLQQSINGLLQYSKAQEGDHADKWANAFRALRDRISQTDPALTLTEACRRAFWKTNKPINAVEVRDYLEAAGYNFDEYKSNPLSSIHTTLKRLEGKGEIRSSKNAPGDGTYYEAVPAAPTSGEMGTLTIYTQPPVTGKLR